MIYTVFPNDQDQMPQDFATFEEARLYGEEFFKTCGYRIESTRGELV